jgi:hypothetical protein
MHAQCQLGEPEARREGLPRAAALMIELSTKRI